MFRLSKILVPVDFSERSAGAASYASRLAHHFHSELTLVHVLDAGIYELNGHEAADPVIRDLSQCWRSRAEARLGTFLTGPLQTPGVHRKVLSGVPADEIVSFARLERTSLVVIPTHGFEPSRRCLLGLVASRILDDADCPVLTGVYAHECFPNGSLSFRSIVCAVDLCPQGLEALVWVSRLADEFRAQLTIAHITPSTAGGVGEYFNPDRRRNWVTEVRNGEFASQARQRIAEMQHSAGTSAAVLIESNMDVPQAVCYAASQIEADLVVVARGSSAGVDRLRTTVCSIVRQSPCPVLSV